MSSFLQDKLQPEASVTSGEGPTGYRAGRDWRGVQVYLLWVLALEPPPKQMKGLPHPRLLHIHSFHHPLNPWACFLCLHPKQETESGVGGAQDKVLRFSKVLRLGDL